MGTRRDDLRRLLLAGAVMVMIVLALLAPPAPASAGQCSPYPYPYPYPGASVRFSCSVIYMPLFTTP